MSDGFISYSRKDREFVRKLHDALEQADLSIWADWQDIPLTADWWQEIQMGIESANNFIAIISPDYVTSEVVKDEIEYALRCNKRLIPILHRESDANRIHSALKKINWIFFREGDDFEKAVRSLIQSINTDLEHVSEHTRLLENAVRWQQKGRDDSLLLHGRALEEAEQRLTFNSNKEPLYTALQKEYINVSRAAKQRRQRIMLFTTTTGLIISTGLALFAAAQWRQAEVGRVQALSAASKATLNSSELEALLEALQSGRRLNRLAGTNEALTSEIVGTLQKVVYQVREQNRLEMQGDRFSCVSFSPDGAMIVTAGERGKVYLWNLQGDRLAEFQANPGWIRSVSFSPNGEKIVAAGANGIVSV
jgi:hypothetical protein